MAINKRVNKNGDEVFIANFRDQRKKRIRKTFPTHKAAADYEKTSLAAVVKQTFQAPSNQTVKEIAEKWLAQKKQMPYRRATLIDWQNHVEHYIVPSLGAKKIDKANNVELIEAAAAEWNQRVSPKMANKVLTTLTAVFNLAQRWQLIEVNQAEKAERRKIPTEQDSGLHRVTDDEVYSFEETGRLIAATEPGSEERVLVMLLSFCGLRIGEALGLCWPAVDLGSEPFIRVETQLVDGPAGVGPSLGPIKSIAGQDRVIGLAKPLVYELKIWKLKCPVSELELVFCRVDQKPRHRNWALKVLNRTIAKAGISRRRLTPHGLRHTFASQAIKQGADVPEVSRILGHASPRITMDIYTHAIKSSRHVADDLAKAILKE